MTPPSRRVPAAALAAVPITLGLAWARLLATFNGDSLIPRYLLTDTLATGGDTGSHHYVASSFGELFPWALGGWATGWFAGMPMLEFYFPVPYLVIWIFDLVLGYEAAFKLGTVLGPLLLPLAAYTMFRLMDAPRPVRAMAPVGALLFMFLEGRSSTTALVFDGVVPHLESGVDTTTLDIFGGFITSMLAGEFAYSLGLALALFAAGLLYRVSRRCGLRLPYGWIAATAVVLGLGAITHIVPTMLVLPVAGLVLVSAPARDRTLPWRIGAGILGIVAVEVAVRVAGGPAGVLWIGRAAGLLLVVALFCWGGWRRWVAIGIAGAVALLLSAFWTLPTAWWHEYVSPSKWINSEGTQWIAPGPVLLLLALGTLGLVAAIVRKHPGGVVIAAWGAFGLLAFYTFPEGQIVNGRFLPLWYLSLALLTAWGIGELIDAIPWTRQTLWVRTAVITAVALVAVGFIWVGFLPESLSRGVVGAFSTKASPWAAHNYRGYECASVQPTFDSGGNQVTDGCSAFGETVITEGASGLAPTWHELEDVIATIDEDVPSGARLAWEYNTDYGRFGTPRVMENIPFFTDVDTMEGLLIESSSSALASFWMQAEYSPSGTGAVPGYQYPATDVPAAIQHMRHYGVEYVMIETQEIKDAFDAAPDVTRIAETPDHQGQSFTIYRIDDTGYVRVPQYWPVRVEEPDADWRTDHGLIWFDEGDIEGTGAILSAKGTPEPGPVASSLRVVDSIEEVGEARPVPTDNPGLVDDVDLERTRISFSTDALGEPHYVAVSSFPNWRVEGAEGPYLLAPSLMVVFPTDEEVTLTYAPSAVERGGMVLSWLGLAAIVLLVVLERRAGPLRPDPEAGADPDLALPDANAPGDASPAGEGTEETGVAGEDAGDAGSDQAAGAGRDPWVDLWTGRETPPPSGGTRSDDEATGDGADGTGHATEDGRHGEGPEDKA